MTGTRMPPRARWALRLGLSLALIAALLLIVDPGELLRLLGSAEPLTLLLLLGLLTADRLLMAFKWWLLVLAQGLPMGFAEAVRAYYISSFAGLFLPMTVGADAVRTLAVRRPGNTPQIVATIVLERGIGAVSQALLSALSVAVIAALGLQLRVSTAGLAVAVAVLLVVLLASLPLSFRIAGWAAARLPRRAGLWEQVARLARAYADSRHRPRVVWTFFLLTVLEGFFPITFYYVGARCLGLELPYILFVATIPLVFMVARLPISLGGIGVLEGSFVLLAGVLGIPETEAFSVVLLTQMVTLVSLLPGAAAYLLTPQPRPREA